MVELKIDPRSLRELERKIERLAALDRNERKHIIKAAKGVGNIYVKAARANIQDYHKDIILEKKNGRIYKIPRGTLRRSMGTWIPKGAVSHIAAGPRSGTFRKLPEKRDGWFAHFVEYGNFPQAFGGKQVTRNTGVFERTKQATLGKMRSEMISAMSKIITDAVKK